MEKVEGPLVVWHGVAWDGTGVEGEGRQGRMGQTPERCEAVELTLPHLHHFIFVKTPSRCKVKLVDYGERTSLAGSVENRESCALMGVARYGKFLPFHSGLPGT